jgi:outer membrane lipoprotein carrier protein
MKFSLVCSKLCILFSLVTLAHADAASDLTNLLNQTQSMKANFSQSTFNNHGKVTQKTTGDMALQRPGKFRWNVTKPMPQLIIANQHKLWIYDPDLEQVTIRAFNETSNDAPALLLSHDNASLDQSFTVTTMTKNAEGKWFLLTPKKKGEMFESIQMGFVNNQIHEMRLQDNLGSNTVIQFQGIQANPQLASSLFVFKPSAKIDVIDETRKK